MLGPRWHAGERQKSASFGRHGQSQTRVAAWNYRWWQAILASSLLGIATKVSQNPYGS